MKKSDKPTLHKVKDKTFYVDKGKNLSTIYDKVDVTDVHTVTGYTIYIDECNLNLTDIHRFVDCTFIVAQDSMGIIESDYRVELNHCTIKGNLVFHTHSHLVVNECSGYSVMAVCTAPACLMASPSCSLYRTNLSKFDALHYSYVYMDSCEFTYIHLADISRQILMVNTKVVSDHRHEAKVYIEKCVQPAIMIKGSSVTGQVQIHKSSPDFVSLWESTVVALSFDHTAVDAIAADGKSLVNILYANASACYESDGFSPKASPLVASYKSGGFPVASDPVTIYKKVNFFPRKGPAKQIILKLSVPPTSIARYSPDTGKIRVSEATPVAAFSIKKNDDPKADTQILIKPMKIPAFSSIRSAHDDKFIYKIGKKAKPTEPFNMSDAECASGIHGFIDALKAASY